MGYGRELNLLEKSFNRLAYAFLVLLLIITIVAISATGWIVGLALISGLPMQVFNIATAATFLVIVVLVLEYFMSNSRFRNKDETDD